MKMEKNVKSLNLINVDLINLINVISSLFQPMQVPFRVEQVLQGILPRGYLLNQLYLVFVSLVYLFLTSFQVLIPSFNLYLYIYIYIYIYIYTINVYRQHVLQMQYQQLKCQEHFGTSGKGEFKIFPLFELHSQNKYLREQYEKYFRVKFKPTLH